MSIMSEARDDIKEAPPWGREWALTEAEQSPIEEASSFSLLLNQEYDTGTKPPGSGSLKRKSDSNGLCTFVSSPSLYTGHRGEPGDEFRITRRGSEPNWSVLEEGKIKTR